MKQIALSHLPARQGLGAGGEAAVAALVENEEIDLHCGRGKTRIPQTQSFTGLRLWRARA